MKKPVPPITRITSALLPIAAPFLLGGCGGATEPTPDRIIVSPDSVLIGRLGRAQLTASVVDGDGKPIAGQTLTFTSADPVLATVSSAGLVTSVGPIGRVEVTIESVGLAVEVPVTIASVPSTIDVTPAAAAIEQGDTLQLDTRVLDGAGEEIPSAVVTYAVDNPALAGIGASGLVRSLGPSGTTKIRLTAGAVMRELPLTIAQKPTSMTVSYTGSGSIPVGGTKQLTATLLDLVGTPVPSPGPIWATTGAPATVSTDGLVTGGSGPGAVVVSATHHDARFGDFTATAKLYIEQATPPDAIIPGDLTTLTTGGSPADVAISPAGAVVAADLGHAGISPGRVLKTDLSSFSAVSTLSTGAQPATVEMDVGGTFAYVAGMEPQPGHGWGVGIIALSNGAQVGYLENGLLDTPYSVALSRDGQVAVMGTDKGTLVIFDVSSGTPRKTIRVPGGLFNHIVAHPSAPKMYASSFGGPLLLSAVVEIDLVTETARELPVNAPNAWKPQGLAVSPDGTELFIADQNNSVMVWNLVSGRSAGIIPAAGHGFGLTQSPDGQTLYLVGGRVLAIDVATHLVTKQYEAPGGMLGLRAAVSHDGSTLVVASNDGRLYRFTP